MQRQVPQIQTAPKTGDFPSINHVTKHVELPQTQHTNKVVDVPAVMQRQVPLIQTSLKTVEVPLAQFVGRVVVALVIMQMCQWLMKRIARWRKGVPQG